MWITAKEKRQRIPWVCAWPEYAVKLSYKGAAKRNTQRSHWSGLNSQVERPVLVGNRRIELSPFWPNLNETVVWRWRRGHQYFLGETSGAIIVKGHGCDARYFRSGPVSVNGGNTKAFSLGDNTWEKTLVPWACTHGNGEKNFKGRPERSKLTLEGREGH